MGARAASLRLTPRGGFAVPHPLYSPVRRDSPLGCLGRALLASSLLLGLALPRPASSQSEPAQLEPAQSELVQLDPAQATAVQLLVAQSFLGQSAGSRAPALATTAQPALSARPLDQGPSAELALPRLLASSDLALLNRACLQAARADQGPALRALRLHLLAVKPAPQPLAVVLSNAEALVNCRAPEDGLNVLNRYGPAPGRERSLWFLAQWRAAEAGLNHRIAARALLGLAEGRLSSLDGLPLTLQVRRDGSLVSRPALEVLADHLVVLGEDQQAAAALLAARQQGQLGAERLQRAVALLVALPLQQRNQLLETALDQAAAAGAWGLAAELLRDQRALLLAAGAQADRPSERFLRLSRRIDDAYGEWQLGREAGPRQDSLGLARQQQLEQQLRSPRQGGGHAAPLP